MIIQRLSLPQNFPPHLIPIILMVIATLLTSIAMVFNKLLVMGDHPPSQIVFWRSIFTIIPLIFLIKRQGGLSSLKPSRPLTLCLRGFMGFCTIVAYCYSLKELSIFSAESLLHLEPILVLLLATTLLRERPRKNTLIATGLAIAGVAIMMTPGSDILSFGGLLAFSSAVFYALEIIMTRAIGKTATSVTIFFHYTLICFLGSCLLFTFEGFYWPTTNDLLVFALIAMLNTGINLSFTEALRRAPASKLAPLEYLTLAWVTLWQIQIWGQLPSLAVAIGSMIILTSGVWILGQESKRKGKAQA
jgi:drug/metabolite transporter (DMT)-like permease